MLIILKTKSIILFINDFENIATNRKQNIIQLVAIPIKINSLIAVLRLTIKSYFAINDIIAIVIVIK